MDTFEYKVLLDIRSNLRQINRGQGQQGVSPQAYAEVRAHCLYLADLVDRQRQELDSAAAWRDWAEDTLKVRAENLANAKKHAEDLDAWHEARAAEREKRIAELEKENEVLHQRLMVRAA
ncbi:hypothetical protein AA12717_0884 [Gluconacetobacter sacchari DSM 12717]|uniref:Uncharacterized protein n=2 Tax=Gluconacetobacter sacchari TaxID=92759 RepID=A0A7W4NPC4_9PROT|nr:hypothetical protein [Gluconacetobacter sacchari]MBB2161606.1 hypothetical protein [Gluconacetobacter sacchari]GBQ21442.1 hypothetical protein AA12717_0884 [Gluconacetobacter sacchari DSM 12717]